MPADVGALLRLQAEVHDANLLEPASCFEAIVAHGLSWVFAADGGLVVGYALVHWGEVSSLGHCPPSVRGPATFLHDVAVSPACRGAGLGSRLVDAVVGAARISACSALHLVALEGTGAFWRARGFTPAAGHDDAPSYGPGAEHLALSLV